VSRLSDLVRQVAKSDPQLAKDIRAEVKALEQRRAFGLNFERHTPESVDLYGRPVRRGDKVRILPERGQPDPPGSRRLWDTRRVRDGFAELASPSVEPASEASGVETNTVPVDDLVVVAEHRDRIYPGLVSTGRIERGGPDKPFHTVINAENFHALEALAYTHEGTVDAIYIDPPYNTGAKDWKYNNDYVDSDDLYRHSKWLAFMERRLKLAKRLLNPENSVLIVTIDEKEYLRLGLLLQQTFPEARVQMVSSVIAPGGAIRSSEFTRVHEFVFFVMFGRAAPVKTSNDMLFTDSRPASANRSAIWNSLRRRGAGNLRADSPSKFYPVFVRTSDGRVLGCGAPLPAGSSDVAVAPGEEAVLPVLPDGRQGRWELNTTSFSDRLRRGYVRAASRDRNGTYVIQYLRNAEIERVANGELISTGVTDAGYHQLEYSDTVLRTMYAKSVWNRTAHDAGTFGSRLVKSLLANRKFPFPKSLYAVEDTLRFFVADKPDAVVLDFFAGSGTTAHAVMRLNKQDGGKRQCISVTNNEVSADEQKSLRKQGLRPGDPEWEQHGICDYITKPRVEAAITGRTPDGDPIKGDYKFTDEFPMSDGFEENAEFFTLTYEDPLRVEHHRSFERIAPLLWLKAGAQGRRIEHASETYEVADTYAILFDLDASHEFLEEVAMAAEQGGLRFVFLLTDDERAYQSLCAELPAHVRPERLYGTYMTQMNHGPRVD